MSTRIDTARETIVRILADIKSDSSLDSEVSGAACVVADEIHDNDTSHLLSLSGETSHHVSAAIRCTDNPYDEDRRTKLKFARYVRRHMTCSYRINDSSLDSLVQIFWQRLYSEQHKPTFTVESGDDLVDRYASGFADRKCMSGDSSHLVQEVYGDNPHIFQMLCFEQQIESPGSGNSSVYNRPLTTLAGRALIVNCHSPKGRNEYLVLDRIYPNTASVVVPMKKWAKDRGYLIRSHNHLPKGTTTFLTTDGARKQRLSLKLPSVPEEWPYLDSFQFGDSDGRTLRTYNSADAPSVYLCDKTDGGRTILRHQKRCQSCRNPISHHVSTLETHRANGGVFCDACYKELFFICGACGVGQFIYPNRAPMSESANKYVEAESSFDTCSSGFSVCIPCARSHQDLAFCTRSSQYELRINIPQSTASATT